MKKYFLAFLVILLIGGLVTPFTSYASSMTMKLNGRILLQVQSHGEAWYINPVNNERYYLGRPADAFMVMRDLGLGITNANFDAFNGKATKNLSGRILLKVQDSGKAYYINPVDLSLNYLGSPAQAFQLMRQFGLGITNTNLEEFVIGRAVSDQTYVPEVVVNNQRLENNSVIIREIVASENGWIVIHKDENNTAGTVVGYAAVTKGENYNKMVNIGAQSPNTYYWAMLHYDRGRIGTYEFPGADIPVGYNGQTVMTKFELLPQAVENRSVSISNFAFDPQTINLSMGDTVIWTNNDSVAHTIVANDNSFTSSNISPGSTYSHTFMSAGSFGYHCSIHPTMTGTVIVE